MSQSSISLLKLNQEGPRVSIARRARMLLSAALGVQVVLAGALCYLQDRAEQYAIRSGRVRDLAYATNQLFLKDMATLTRIEKALKQNLPLNASVVNDIEDLQEAVQRIKSLKPGKTEDWTGLRELLDGKHSRDYLETWQSAAKTADVLAESTLTAWSAYKEITRLPATSEKASLQRDHLQFGIQKSLEQAQKELLDYAERERLHTTKLSPEQVAQTRIQWETAIMFLIAIDVLFMTVVALFFSRQILGKLSLMLDNSLRLAMNEPLNEPMSGFDEFARVDAAFHTMAEALNESARQQRAIVENARDLICTLDAKSNFVDVSSASQVILDYPPEKLLGGKLSSLVYKDDLESTLAALQAIMEGQGKESFETRVTKRDGAVIDMLWSATWSAAERKVFCVARDITERKAAERLRQDVVQMVSHDLRSPLATIESFHEMLEQGILGDLNERGQKLLHIADRNSQRMLALIDDLLDIEKMEAGALELHKSDVPLSAIFEQSIHAVFAWSKEKDVALDYEPTELTVFADGDRLVQVLVNLLSNAVKFSPRGRAVTLLARQLPQAVEIDVIDRGRGIPAHMLGSIFDRFKQVRESDAREKRGTGLGLAICKALVALHEGTIRVQSAEGEGTVFTVHLPQ